MKATPAQRLLEKVQVDQAGCWIFTGSSDHRGYGRIWGKPYECRPLLAHRFSYVVFTGPIPDGLEIDHRCKRVSCVNPEHLEAVTPFENRRRSEGPSQLNTLKTHCAFGHELTPANSYSRPNRVERQCRACRARRSREYASRVAKRKLKEPA